MEPEEIQNYQQTLLNNVFAQKLEQNGKQIETWTDYKNRHKKVIEGLRVFPLSVSENCMVPIGKRALMKGRLTHTNEILVCLGDGYFAKYSASQAIALCNRRIAWADEMLKGLEAERDLYETRQIFLERDIFEKERKNIVEHWNESKLDEWRVQHKQHEREYNKRQAKLREKEKTDVSTDADLFKRLDELELEEELEDKRLEVRRKEFYDDDLIEGEVYDESEEYDTSDSDEITMEMLEEELKKLKDIKSNKVISDIENASSSDTTQDNMNINTVENEQSNSPVDIIQGNLNKICSSDTIELIPTSKSINVKKKGRISFAEYDANDESNAKDKTFQKDCYTMQDNTHSRAKDIEDDEDIVKIKFSHSSHIPNIPESNNSEIQSPVDIYKTFFMPKPILKRSPNDMAVQTAIPVNENSSTDTEDDDNVKSFAYESIIKEEVQEKKQVLSVNDISIKDKKKIISKFKKERAAVRT